MSTTQVDPLQDTITKHLQLQRIARENRITRPLTDLGNAERLIDSYHDVLRFDHTAGKWLLFDGRHWATDNKHYAPFAARRVVRAIYAEAEQADAESERKAIADHAKRSESQRAIKAMLELAKSDPHLSTVTTDYDRDPDILNCSSGIIDLKTGELQPHESAQMCAKIAPVDYDPKLLEQDKNGVPAYVHAAPGFFSFLNEITLSREDLQNYIQCVVGYGLTGHAIEQILCVLVGTGANGKGVLLRVLRAILGDYAQTAPPNLIIDEGNRGGASPEVARLVGARLLEIEETDDGDRLHEAKVKWLTGLDILVARFLHREYFEFFPTFTPLLITNHKPRVVSGSYSIWRRLRVIPFDYTPEVKDKNLFDRLSPELPAVLAWAVDGARQWYAQGLPDSPTVNAASAEYRQSEDALKDFLDEMTTQQGNAQVKASLLYKAYKSFTEDAGDRPMSSRRFSSAMGERGYKTEHTRNGNIYFGIGLRA